MRTWYPFRLAGLLFCVAEAPANAQSKPPPTPVVTQQLIDDVVNAISTAVVEKLKKDGTIAPKPSVPEERRLHFRIGI